MFNRIAEFISREPARTYLLVRALLAILAGAGFASFSPELGAEIAGFVAILLGIDVATTEKTRAGSYAPETASRLLAGANSNVLGTEAGALIMQFIRPLVPKIKLPEAIATILPIATEYAQAAITPDVRAEIQRKVHSALRKAKLLHGRDIGITKAVSIVLLLGLLASCAPISRVVVGASNEVTGDQAVLGWAISEDGVTIGVFYDPGTVTALAVIVDIQGEELQALDPADNCTAYEYGLDCRLGDVTEETTIELAGLDVTATATWTREGSSRIYHEVLGN